ncbi:hypothetical protein N9K77_01105, partial [bacterium]|nr:hypothetical protein [bacterium]
IKYFFLRFLKTHASKASSRYLLPRLPGDEIKTIDEIEISNKTLEEIGSLLKGPCLFCHPS